MEDPREISISKEDNQWQERGVSAWYLCACEAGDLQDWGGLGRSPLTDPGDI